MRSGFLYGRLSCFHEGPIPEDPWMRLVGHVDADRYRSALVQLFGVPRYELQIVSSDRLQSSIHRLVAPTPGTTRVEKNKLNAFVECVLHQLTDSSPLNKEYPRSKTTLAAISDDGA